MKKLSVLGSTGSIGTQALDVARTLGFEIEALSCASNVDLLFEQIVANKPKIVCVKNPEDKEKLIKRLKDENIHIKVVCGEEGLFECASSKCDILLNAIVGFGGLMPTLFAIDSGNNVAIANKESLVAAGSIVKDRALKNNVSLIPVDSEHSAIWQCLYGEDKKSVSKLVLTASGGPFLHRENLSNVTVDEATRHPNWSMGKKITIDSASMMNKSLEVVEASVLFDVSYEMIDIIIHPESIIHSWVNFIDGSSKAQFSVPDMRIPIQLALTYTDRFKGKVDSIDMAKVSKLSFYEVDYEKFPASKLGHLALKLQGVIPAVMSAANEAAVDLFVNKDIGFLDIPMIVKEAMESTENVVNPTITEIIEADRAAREFVYTNRRKLV